MKEVESNDVLLIEPFSILGDLSQYNKDCFKNPNIDQMLEIDSQIFQANNLSKSKKEYREAGKSYKEFIPLNNMEKGISKMPEEPTSDDMTKSINVHAEEVTKNLDVTIKEKKGTAVGKAAELYKNQINLVMNKNYVEALKHYSLFGGVTATVFTSLPEPSFKTGVNPETKKPVYKTDFEKFEQLMGKYKFLDYVEKSQKFIAEETIPYVEAKKNGTLTKEQAQAYNEKYLNHLKEMKNLSNTLKTVDMKDPLVGENRTFIVNAKMDDLRWRKPAGAISNYIDDINTFKNNGWAVRDHGLLVEIKKWYEDFGKVANDKAYSSKDKKKVEAKKVLKDKNLKKAYNELFSTKIDSVETRNLLLSNFKMYADKYKDPTVPYFPLGSAIDDAINSKAYDFEYGIAPSKNVEKKSAAVKTKKTGSKKEKIDDDIIKINDENTINDDNIINTDTNSKKNTINDNIIEVNGEEIDLNDSFEVETKLIDDTIKEDTDKPLEAFDRASVSSINIQTLKKDINNLYKKLDKVDYFMFGKSSPEFNRMMKAMKDLKNKVDTLADRRTEHPSLDDMTIIEKHTANTLNKIEEYLQHKHQDFKDDGTRRDSENSQKREQPRIKTSIELFEKLKQIESRNIRAVEKTVKPIVNKFMINKLKIEQDKRANNDLSAAQYRDSVITSLYYIQFADSGYKTRGGVTDFDKYQKRLVNTIEKPPTHEGLKSMYRNSKDLQQIVQSVMPHKNKNVQLPDKLVTTADLVKEYKEKVKQVAMEQKTGNKMDYYKQELYSRQTNQKLGINQNQNKTQKNLPTM
jgi:hypothetical protein